MDVRKQLAISIITFLKTELKSERLGEEGTEALEVAVQCLENAYVVDGVQCNDNVDLLTIYESALTASGTSIGTMHPPQPTMHPPPMHSTPMHQPPMHQPPMHQPPMHQPPMHQPPMHQPPMHQQTMHPPTSNIYPEASQVNKEMAESKKIEGNDFMRDGKYNEAIVSYTNAIELDPNNAIYYSNRAAAYAKLNDNKNSIIDCEKALKIDPQYSKAYGRMGLAHFNDENYEKAIAAYENALVLDPANQPYKVQLESAKEKLNEKLGQGGQAGAGSNAPNPLAGMDLNSLLSNPAVMNMAQSFMSNPQVQNMFANMMGGAPGGAPNGAPNQPQQPPPPQGAAAPEPTPPPPPNPAAAGFGSAFGNIDFNTVLNATSQFAAQMQQQNPDMVENLRAQFQQGPNQQDEQKPDPK